MILSDASIRKRLDQPEHSRAALRIEPLVLEAKQYRGLSYGLSCAGYDIRIGAFQDPNKQIWRLDRNDFILVCSLEWMKIPHDVTAIVHDKSSWARQGIALQNTVLEPGWKGFITLEVSNHGKESIVLRQGQPIAQVVFHLMTGFTEKPYNGKYQDQADHPVEAILPTDTEEATNGITEFGRTATGS